MTNPVVCVCKLCGRDRSLQGWVNYKGETYCLECVRPDQLSGELLVRSTDGGWESLEEETPEPAQRISTVERNFRKYSFAIFVIVLLIVIAPGLLSYEVREAASRFIVFLLVGGVLWVLIIGTFIVLRGLHFRHLRARPSQVRTAQLQKKAPPDDARTNKLPNAESTNTNIRCDELLKLGNQSPENAIPRESLRPNDETLGTWEELLNSDFPKGTKVRLLTKEEQEAFGRDRTQGQ